MCCALLLLIPVALVPLLAFLATSRQELLLGTAAELLSQSGAALASAPRPLLWLAAGAGWVSLLVTAFVATATAWVAAVYAFATADADVGLLLRGRHRDNGFEGKVVWVTGASQGLGAELAKYLARHGAKVIVSARNEDNLRRTKAACRRPQDVVALPFDLLDSDDKLAAAAKAADEAFGGAGVDYLVHNAGASQHALAAETTGEVAEKLLQLNALGPIRLTQAALPFMLKRRKGRLVVVASMAAKVPSPGQAVYSAAKAACWGYFSSLAAEVADQGISVTFVCPGPVAAPIGESSTRSLYGATGAIQRHEVQDGRRMHASRCVTLIANAMAAGVGECWLAQQPVLLLAYIMQYAPAIGMLVLKHVGPKRARALVSGRSGYDVAAFLRPGPNSGSSSSG